MISPDRPVASPHRPTRVVVHPDGPYLLSGDLEVTSPDGSVVRRLSKAALCRCGRSASKPFCDGSHSAQGFRDPGLPAQPAGTRVEPRDG